MFGKRLMLAIAAALVGSACSKDPDTPRPDTGSSDGGADMTIAQDTGVDAAADLGVDMPADLGPDMPSWTLEPVPEPPDETATDEARAAGFKLYYRERLDRVVLAANRYHLMGDVGWATTTRGARVARTGNQLEVLVGPSDNNKIGTTVWNVYNAYRVFGTRELELTLLRLLNGLVFLEQVTGHPGMTSREAYPGWTRVVDGVGGSATRTRMGTPVTSPLTVAAPIEAEIISTFFSGLEVTYRENPEDFMFSLFPALDPGKYAMTISFIELPKVVRSGECCSSLMRTPDDKQWAGAYWGNHNSRDNFPDLGLGYLAARLAAADTTASADVRAAAAAAVAGGEHIGDAILANNTSIMTVSNIGTYDTLEVSGTIRPHGEPENQDLGSLGVCPMAFLAQAMTAGGLNPGVPIPLPRSTDKEFFSSPQLQANLNCQIPDEPVCVSLDDGFCGRPWGAFKALSYQGQPILEWFDANPPLAKVLLESWQNDFDDVTEAAMVVYKFAEATGDADLLAQARRAVFDLTDLQNDLADRAYADDAGRRGRQRLRSALYKAECDLPADAADFGAFAQFDQEAQAAENSLNVGDTQPAGLLTDGEIEAAIEAKLADSTLPHVVERYRTTYTDGPPVRRTATGYEAKGDSEAVWPWRDVEVPRHASVGSPALLDGVVLCEQAPQWLSCAWAKLGCTRPDIDQDRTVTASDVALFEAAQTMFAGQTCDDTNTWCDGADLDRNGATDASDAAFMSAADGCWY